eukprot:4386185-Lingulodinium_polyedra.AAC.1
MSGPRWRRQHCCSALAPALSQLGFDARPARRMRRRWRGTISTRPRTSRHGYGATRPVSTGAWPVPRTGPTRPAPR